MRNFIFLFLISTLYFSCSSEEEDTSLDTSVVFEELNLSYGTDVKQKYDVYLPPNRSASTTDVIVLVHGGSWVGGDKSDVTDLVDVIQEILPDYAVVNMNYRLTSGMNYPLTDQLNDVDNFMVHIDEESDYYGISDSYVMIGVSAGGHMILQHSYSRNDNRKIKVACNIVGPTYFLDPSYIESEIQSFQLLAGSFQLLTGVPITDTEFYDAISPLKQVSSSSVPTIQFFGSEDELIPITQGPLLAAALDAVNVPNEITIYEGEGHGWADPLNWLDTFQKIEAFISLHVN
ncbi:MAG: acetyl esterase/lipase [Saprospiraceae bacterium]|jgi:acetyl esterase/lipase